MRLSRTFHLGERWRVQAIAEVFNTLNHRNDMIPNAVFGAGAYPGSPLATFGQATAVGDPRSAELALRGVFEAAYNLIGVAFFRNAGSNSKPKPGPVGSGITPLRIWKFGVYQGS